MLVLVACCYLACNLLNVVVTAWEFIDVESLMTPEARPLYTYSADLVSLLTLLSISVRLPIYYTCNSRIRREVNAYLSYFMRLWCSKSVDKATLLSLQWWCCCCRTCATAMISGRMMPKLSTFSRDNISLATMRHLNAGNGYVVYRPSRKSTRSCEETYRTSSHASIPPLSVNKPMIVGTDFDRIVLEVAMKEWRKETIKW